MEVVSGAGMNGRTPPNDEHAERVILGSAMSLGRIPQAASGLVPSDFYHPTHAMIWAAMIELGGQQKPCDITVLRAHLQERGLINTQMGIADLYLFELLEQPAPADAAYVAQIIEERAKRRLLIEALQRGIQSAYESSDDVDAQLSETLDRLGRVPRVARQSEYQFLPGGSFILDSDPMPRALWGESDRVIWSDGEALIIAGAQGLGKTTLAQQLALGWIGIHKYSSLLGFPIEPGRRVLYLAMDRPRQAQRSFRRMVTEEERDALDDRLVVWKGPPPADLAKHPELLLRLCDEAYADAVIVDSLKDAAIPLSDDEVGAGYNRARQLACAKGVQIVELHHLRKALSGAKAEHPSIDDLYGSTWITSGAGSVVLLTGRPGDPIVHLHHLKQPAVEVGPFSILHNDVSGRSEMWHSVDLIELVRVRGSITALDAAKALYETEKPSPAEREKARRRLDRLVADGFLWPLDPGDRATNRPASWTVK